jgi:hypothetical protein|tara:strand:+ start:25 stop:315 length:291 start_codon:yes stop_codon:yes gene_type:complete
MGITTNGKTTVIEEEVSILNKEDIEFLLNIITNSMVPGKYLGLGNRVVQKLNNKLGIIERSRPEILKSLKKYKQNSNNKVSKNNTVKDGELWIEEN